MQNACFISDHTKRYQYFAAILLCLTILFLGTINLDNNCNWGDDHAAYLLDGIALAKGSYEEQIKLNVILRSGKLVGSQESHVHVWGYPLLHAITYRFAGFDTENFSNIYCYKLSSLILFSIMSGVLYLFLRRRFGVRLSLFLTLLIGADREFHYAIRNLYSDIVFLSLSTCAFFLVELYLEERAKKRRLLLGIFLGFLLWYLYSVRHNGIVAVLCVILAQLFWLMEDKSRLHIREIIPVAVFGVLYFLVNALLFPRPTATSSVSDVSIQTFLNGCGYYFDQLLNWLQSLVERILGPFVKFCSTALYSLFDSETICAVVSRTERFIFRSVFRGIAFLILAFSVLGLFTTGIRRDKHIVVFVLISFLGTSLFSLGQELRYLYVILPFLLLYAVHGCKQALSWLPALHAKPSFISTKSSSRLSAVLTAVLCLLVTVPLLSSGIINLRSNTQEDLTSYSDGAIEIYRFIQEEVPEDARIAFFKPRSLYLNTGRVSILPEKGGFSVEDADYYLYYIPSEQLLISESSSLYEKCFENYEFILYKKIT